MKNLIFLTFLFLSSQLYSQNKEFSAELNYHLNELDNEITAEILALNRVKLDLFFQVYNYIDSSNIFNDDFALKKNEIKALIPCIIKTETIEKSWQNLEYKIKLSSNVDNAILQNRLDRSSRIKEELDRIVQLKDRSNDANLEIETLKRAIQSEEFDEIKLQLLHMEYQKSINVLKEEELFQRGYLSFLNMKHDTSVSYFKKMVELNPENEFGFYNLALNYTALEDDDQAIKYFKKTLKIDPKFAEANYKLGVLYLKSGDEYNAKRYLNRASWSNHKKAKKLLRP
ncbi:MAG: tetratricopeptide repeat protein [Bacteroidota bacterium]